MTVINWSLKQTNIFQLQWRRYEVSPINKKNTDIFVLRSNNLYTSQQLSITSNKEQNNETDPINKQLILNK